MSRELTKEEFSGEFGQGLADELFADVPDGGKISVGDWEAIPTLSVVILRDCKCHSVNDVLTALYEAGLSVDVAVTGAYSAHRYGAGCIFYGERSRCESLASALHKKELDVEVTPLDWNV